MVSLVWWVLAGGAALALGVAWRRALAGGDGGPERWLGVATPPLWCVAGALVAGQLVASLGRAWNDMRLAPTAALLRGYQLYYLPGTGPALSFDKGPLSALVYVPAVLWPRPDVAVILGFLITAALFFVPVAGWLRAAAAGKRRLAAVLFLGFFYYVTFQPALAGPAFWVHADAPALGFGALSCWLLADRVRPGRQAASAACAVLALGSKQLALPLAPALLIYLVLADGPAAAWRYARWLALLGVGAFLALVPLVHLDAMWFQTVTLHAGQPWQWGGGIRALGIAGGELLRAALPALLVLGLATAGAWRAEGAAQGAREFLRRHAWTLPALVGLLSIPLALLGRVKMGGDTNNFAYSIYYVSLAAMLGMVELAAVDRRVRGAVKVGALLIAALPALVALPALAKLPPAVAALPDNPETTGFAAARAAPGEFYFPFHPLLSVMAEGKAYHTSYGLYDLALAGRPLTPAEFRAYVPPAPRWVAVRDPNDYALRYLVGYTGRPGRHSLPGWTLFGPPE